MKALLSLTVIATLSSCGNVSRLVAAVTGTSEVCHDGITYVQFPSGVSVKYSPEGRLVSCGEGEER
jgi:uncharacterized protein YceK